jgi:hypothetical protein
MGTFTNTAVICADLWPAKGLMAQFPSPQMDFQSICGLGWYRRGPSARHLDSVPTSGPKVRTNTSPARGWANGPLTGRDRVIINVRGPKVRANHQGGENVRFS